MNLSLPVRVLSSNTGGVCLSQPYRGISTMLGLLNIGSRAKRSIFSIIMIVKFWCCSKTRSTILDPGCRAKQIYISVVVRDNGAFCLDSPATSLSPKWLYQQTREPCRSWFTNKSDCLTLNSVRRTMSEQPEDIVRINHQPPTTNRKHPTNNHPL